MAATATTDVTAWHAVGKVALLFVILEAHGSKNCGHIP